MTKDRGFVACPECGKVVKIVPVTGWGRNQSHARRLCVGPHGTDAYPVDLCPGSYVASKNLEKVKVKK